MSEQSESEWETANERVAKWDREQTEHLRERLMSKASPYLADDIAVVRAEARRQLAETRAFHEKWRQEILGHHAEDMKAARKGVGVALFVGFCAGWFVSFLVFGG